MIERRKICIVTSTRADYGILSRLISSLYNDDDINLLLVVTGTHLSDKFGMTINEINVPVSREIDIEIEKTPIHSSVLAMEKFYDFFIQTKPDILVLLGDRYEILSVAIASMHANIPIAHLYGGDNTFGAIDEAIRHSITKMSQLHFVSCESSRKRVIQLGENPARVFNFGALGVENIKKIPLMEKTELEESLNFKFNKRNFLVTFHPVTLEGNSGNQFKELMQALKTFKDTNIIVTCPNSDSGNQDIFELIKNLEQTQSNVKSFTSLGIKRYLSCLKYVDMVIGNSSSGIYEAPSFKIPTINIGNRQKGREQAKSVINCKPLKQDIIEAINRGYALDCSTVQNPYEKENTALNIINIIKTFPLEQLIEKEFYNLP